MLSLFNALSLEPQIASQLTLSVSRSNELCASCGGSYELDTALSPLENSMLCMSLSSYQSNNGKTKAAEEGWFVKSTEVYPIYFNVSLFLKEYISDFAVRGSIAELINALVFILCGPWKCILKLKPMLSGYLVLDQSWSTDRWIGPARDQTFSIHRLHQVDWVIWHCD